MSTMRFIIVTAIATTTVTASTTGRSPWNTEFTAHWPMPWRLNTVSVITAPPSSAPRSRPMRVTTGVRLARRPCLKITLDSDSPLTLAVRM